VVEDEMVGVLVEVVDLVEDELVVIKCSDVIFHQKIIIKSFNLTPLKKLPQILKEFFG
jgi:hypothetical protein